MSAGFCPYRFHPRVRPDASAPSLITHVRAFVIGSKDLEEKSGGGADCHSQVCRACVRASNSRRVHLIHGTTCMHACACVRGGAGDWTLDRRHAHRQPHVSVPSLQSVAQELGHQCARYHHCGGGTAGTPAVWMLFPRLWVCADVHGTCWHTERDGGRRHQHWRGAGRVHRGDPSQSFRRRPGQ